MKDKMFFQKGDNMGDIEKTPTHSLGKLDWSIYNCITEEHTVDEVIVTDEQLKHIYRKHPEAYGDVIRFIKDILSCPDYIIRDKRPNTGLVIKRLAYEGNSILLVLRICTGNDKRGYKNSVITSWKITEKRLRNYLKNKEVIYKKE